MKATIDKIVPLKGSDKVTIMLTATRAEAKEIAYLQFDDARVVTVTAGDVTSLVVPEKSTLLTALKLFRTGLAEFENCLIRQPEDEGAGVGEGMMAKTTFFPEVGGEKTA